MCQVGGNLGGAIGPLMAALIVLPRGQGAIAVGTLIGGQLTDRIGRLPMIWISIVGALPFTLALPYANLFWSGVLTVIIGLLTWFLSNLEPPRAARPAQA